MYARVSTAPESSSTTMAGMRPFSSNFSISISIINPRRYAFTGKKLFERRDFHLAEVEDGGGKTCVHLRNRLKQLHEILERAGAAGAMTRMLTASHTA